MMMIHHQSQSVSIPLDYYNKLWEEDINTYRQRMGIELTKTGGGAAPAAIKAISIIHCVVCLFLYYR